MAIKSTQVGEHGVLSGVGMKASGRITAYNDGGRDEKPTFTFHSDTGDTAEFQALQWVFTPDTPNFVTGWYEDALYTVQDNYSPVYVDGSGKATVFFGGRPYDYVGPLSSLVPLAKKDIVSYNENGVQYA